MTTGLLLILCGVALLVVIPLGMAESGRAEREAARADRAEKERDEAKRANAHLRARLADLRDHRRPIGPTRITHRPPPDLRDVPTQVIPRRKEAS